MKKWLLLSVILGAVPFTMTAQDDDDMYFVPTKANVEKSMPVYEVSHPTTYAGSNRNVDEYNRRGGMVSHYEPIAAKDSTGNDVIEFSAVEGVYPDSLSSADDFQLTRQMSRWEGYDASAIYNEGYAAGAKDARDTYYRSSWHSPWFYSSYYPWYTPGWEPWYAGYYDWYYDPWYWNSMYGWPYDPWNWTGWYGPYRWYYGWDSLYYPGGGWHHDYWYDGPNGGGGRYGRANYTGSIDRGGSTYGRFTGYRGNSSSAAATASAMGGSSRYNSARNRTVSGHSSYSDRSYTNDGGNFSGTRSTGSISSSGASTSFGHTSTGGGGGGGSRGGSISRGGRR